MGLLKHLRSKTKIRPYDDQDPLDQPLRSPPSKTATFSRPSPAANPRGRDYSARLPPQLLERICSFICPHSVDHSYVASENSAIGDGCMLCDMRDLARTAQVSRRWYKAAQSLLYTSVRIDAVHYCELEALLSEKRHRKSFRHPSVEGKEDIPGRRLSLFCRTVRESSNLAQQVEILKLPYMTRETSKGELAATVSVLSSLKYVDLPEGVFDGDPSCHTLVNELQARCPQIRRMAFRKGAETYLESLTDRHWASLEQLELSGVSVEPSLLRIILASLPTLKSLALLQLPWINDSIFENSPNLPAFPCLEALAIEDCPNITSRGIRIYLSDQRNRNTLSRLRLRRTGITVSSLTEFLYDAVRLQYLTLISRVNFADTLPLTTTPLLASISLRVLNFEIMDADEHAPNLTKPSAAFYSYLARSLHSNSLPSLQTLYVRDTGFPDLLLRPPQQQQGMNGASASTLAAPLEVYSKGLDEAEWIYTVITQNFPHQHTSRSDPSSNSPSLFSSGGRPLSAYNASRGLGPQWGGSDSVMVGNGFGGYLAVPRDESPRPRSAGSDRPDLLAPPGMNGMGTSLPNNSFGNPQVGYQSTLKAGATNEGWPAAAVGPHAFSSRPKSAGSPATSSSHWPTPVMQSGVGTPSQGDMATSPPSNKFSGLMAKVGVPMRQQKPKGQKYDLWR